MHGEMWMSLLFVALGGAIGACLRYGAGVVLVPLGAQAAAYATLLVNVVGSLLLGLLSAWAIERAVSPALWLFFGVGVLGAFTTFSAFSRETILMMVDGAMLRAVVYIGANLIGSLAAFALGQPGRLFHVHDGRRRDTVFAGGFADLHAALELIDQSGFLLGREHNPLAAAGLLRRFGFFPGGFLRALHAFHALGGALFGGSLLGGALLGGAFFDTAAGRFPPAEQFLRRDIEAAPGEV